MKELHIWVFEHVKFRSGVIITSNITRKLRYFSIVFGGSFKIYQYKPISTTNFQTVVMSVSLLSRYYSDKAFQIGVKIITSVDLTGWLEPMNDIYNNNIMIMSIVQMPMLWNATRYEVSSENKIKIPFFLSLKLEFFQEIFRLY